MSDEKDVYRTEGLEMENEGGQPVPAVGEQAPATDAPAAEAATEDETETAIEEPADDTQ